MAKEVTKAIIVTGSRAFSSKARVFYALEEQAPALVIHGGCPRGADIYAEEWAGLSEVDSRVYRAHWEHDGKTAGLRRNARMINANAGATVLAFIEGPSRGTRHCAGLARIQGHRVLVYDAGGQIAVYGGGRLILGDDVL